jgi:hypothetical protein
LSNLFLDRFVLFMADYPEPKKETVRIALPPKPQPPGAESRDTARIHLPARPPAPRPPSSPAPLPPPAPRSSGPSPGLAAAAIPETRSEPKKETARIALGVPKKETARITVLPDLPAKSSTAPTVQMKKTQPLSRMPDIAPPSAPINVATAAPEPETELIVDEIPMSFCWALLGISAAILIIQIWTYLS